MTESEAIKEFRQNIDMPLEVTYQEKRPNLQYQQCKSRYRRNLYTMVVSIVREYGMNGME